jgi:hypothetical protein
MIEHSVRGKVNTISLRNGVMDGVLKDSKGNTVRRITNATRVRIIFFYFILCNVSHFITDFYNSFIGCR